MNYRITAASDSGSCSVENNEVLFVSEKNAENVFFRFSVDFNDWEKDTFVFMPACAYNGNKFKKVNRKYPPKYLLEEYSPDNEPLINNIPSINPDGSGEIEVTSGDMATPCVGIFYRRERKALFILTKQQVKGKNIGFSVKEGNVTVSFPANRKSAYRFDSDYDKNPDSGISVKKGEKIISRILIKEFSCADFAEFYEEFFKIRKSLIKSVRTNNLYTRELWDVLMSRKREGYANLELNPKKWRCSGWAGGTMATAAYLKNGTAEDKEYVIKRLDVDTLPAHQSPSGFFYTGVEDGTADNSPHFIRLSADTLYFLFKHFELTEPKQQWIDAARKCADAFVNLFNKYGKFGFLIDSQTGEMLVGSGDAGAIAIAGLAKAGEFFGEEKYIKTAVDAGEYYFNKFMDLGFSFGGPLDALSAPDSESAFALLEGAVILYEVTKDEKWLRRARVYADYCSSWVVSYAYRFLKESEFARLQINTVGSMFANVQNKHSAPGIAVLSGDCIYKLYKYTKNADYLEFIKDIAYFIPQCVSTKERPIIARIGQPEGAVAFRLPVDEPIPEGTINERVNMSDWEYEKGVGNIFWAPCWCTEPLLLSFSELMDYDEFKDDCVE